MSAAMAAARLSVTTTWQVAAISKSARERRAPSRAKPSASRPADHERSFVIQAICIDRFGRGGYAELEEAGVIDIITVAWVFDGIGFHAPIGAKQYSMRKYADQYIG
ncbi:hypothetical protein ABH922_000269 [Rhodococcus sp. 27YEA15]